MKVKRALVPFLILLIAVGVTVALVKSRKLPEPHESPYLGPLVEVAELVNTSRQVVVTGTGTVQSRYEVTLTPQVKGPISELSEQMVAGGTFRAGELLFAIEDADYRLAIDLARAGLAKAELELQRTENLAVVARQEWQALNPASNSAPDPLVVYEPQLKSAAAQLVAARATVKQAELNLQRTRVVAPFNGYVRSEQLEVGQFLNAGVPVATIAGTGQAEIVVPLPLDELSWLQVPRDGKPQKGSPATVALESGGKTFRWQGVISRALGEIDPRNRMARVVVTVDAPVGDDRQGGNLFNEIMPGMFVQVELQGEELSDVVVVPRVALHDNDTVWIVNENNRLHIRPVTILRRERDEVLIGSGLAAGERIVLTNLAGASEGLLLRPQLQESVQ